MFTMTFAVTAMICCGLVHGGSSEGLPKKALDMISAISGYFDNQEQIDTSKRDYNFIQLWNVPVHVPVFGSKPALLFMEAENGKLIRITLFVVSSTEEDVIIARPYNFTNPSLYKPGEFPLKHLDNLTKDQLHTDPDCLTTYEQIGADVFTGKCPLCELTINGKHPVYTVSFNCDEICGTPPKGVKERHAVEMYSIRRKGDKYKLPYAPDNYVGPCDKQPREKHER